MSNSIIQWNCRGLKANFNDIGILLSRHNPIAVCLQETFLKTTDQITFKNFSFYNKVYTGGEKASGGVSIVVNNNFPHKSVALDTELQAVAVSVTMHQPLTICSIYIPPSAAIEPTLLDNLITQLPSPFILLGDFNSHSTIWGCKDTNARGQTIESFISRNSLCLFNTRKSHTYLHPATGTYSAIDLSLCSPSLFTDFSWKVYDDLLGSDHFPILLQEHGPPLQHRVPRWKLHKADWALFQHLCEERLKPDVFKNCEDPAELFSDLLHDIAKAAIPQSSTKPKRANKPWFDDKCKQAVKERKQALSRFTLRPTTENLNEYRIS